LLTDAVALALRWLWPTLSPRAFPGVAYVIDFVVIISGVACLVAIPYLYHRRQRRRFQSGCCRQCGYNLSAHKTGDRCPECGATILSKVEAMPKR